MSEPVTTLWRPPEPRDEATQIAGFLRWLREQRGRSFDGYADLWQWSVADLEGFWGSLWEFFGVRASTPYERVLGSREMPGSGVVHRGAPQLRRAHAGRPTRTRPGRGDRPLADARAGRADLRRSARAGRRGARRAAAARRGAGGPRRRLPAEHPRDAGRLPCHRQPRRDLGGVPAGVRPAQPSSTASRCSSRRSCSRWRATATASARSTARAEVAEIRAALPSLEHVVHVPYGGGADDGLPGAR